LAKRNVQLIFEVPQASGDSLVQSGTCHDRLTRFQSKSGDEAGAFRGLHISPRRLIRFSSTNGFPGGIRLNWRIPELTAEFGGGQNVLSIVVEVEHSRLFAAC
jgi:hypothetical protein